MGTITKALDMLNFFSRTKGQIGLGEFVRLSGRDKATVHRHLVELEANGFLSQDPLSRAYHMGPAILRLASVREATNPLRITLKPIITALSQEVGELAHASLLQGHVLSPVFNADPGVHGTQVHFDEAELLPLHATSSGIAVLAFSPPEFRNEVLARPATRFTSHTITDATALAKLIADVRRTGISRLARTFDEEVASQAAAIFDSSGAVIGALAVAVPATRAKPDRLDTIARVLLPAAMDITRALSGQYPDLDAALEPGK